MAQPQRKPDAEYAMRTMITPAMAAKYLDLNRIPNRNLKDAHIYRLAKDMSEGRWRCNGEPIIFDRDGNILDGQHRLYAIVRSKVTIETYIVHGMDQGVMSTLDRGSLRSMADILGMQGEINRTQLAAALSWLWSYEHGGMQSYKNPVQKPTSGELEETLLRHPDIRASCSRAKQSAELLIVGLGTALHYLFSQKDALFADKFFVTLGHGEHLSKTDGLYLLRERLHKNRMERRKLPAVDIAALTIKAWNAHRTNTALRVLRWRKSNEKDKEGNAPEPFPAII